MNHMKTRTRRILYSACLACLVCVLMQINVRARDLFTSGYIQTMYNQNNEIGSNEVNCVYQSKSGYIWVGTEGGLYRSDGSGFTGIYLWDENRVDIYSIRCLTQDESGCMWIGTDNYGLFYFEHGEVGHFRAEYYDGIKEIVSVCESEDGSIFVATGKGLFVVQQAEDGSRTLVPFADDKVSRTEYDGLVAVNEEIWALRNGKYIDVLTTDALKYVIDLQKTAGNEVGCIEKIGDTVYCGTVNGHVVAFSGYDRTKSYETSLFGINKIMGDRAGRIWVGAEDGLGYINDKEEFVQTKDMKVNSYISDMIQDYEGNYWVASNRTGLLFLAKSKFMDYNMRVGLSEGMVNCVFKHDGITYIGMDDGLVTYAGTERQVSDLTETLSGVTIRDITVDQHGVLWISTVRSFGLVRVDRKGNAKRAAGGSDFPSTAVNTALVLESGNILVGTERGLAMVDWLGKSVDSFNDLNLLNGCNVLSLFQDKDGLIYVGTDGAGIYTFREAAPEETEHYTMDDGLNSDVVTAIKRIGSGIFIATDDGLSFYNETFRSVSNVEHSNSIYDIKYDSGYIWIIGSRGVLHATEDELLGGNQIENRYYSVQDGLLRELNAVGHSFTDEKGTLFICCNNGLYTLNTKSVPVNETEPRIKVTAIDVDGVKYEFDELGGSLTVPSDTSRLAISFAVYSFSNRDNIAAEYKLTGFDETPIVVKGTDTMEAVYTNLAGGDYQFEISAQNADGTHTSEPVSFEIKKIRSLFENKAARTLAYVLTALLLLLVLTVTIRVIYVIRRKNKEIEVLAKEHEEAVKTSFAKNDYLANMSNEIKTPINAMIAKADELIKVMGEDDAGRSDVQSICDIGENILGRVDDIILLAKLEAGSMEAVSENYSISTLMYEVSEYAAERLSEGSVRFLVEIGDVEKDYLMGDEEKLVAVLKRLIDNAILYTKDGSITLSVDCYIYNDDKHKNMANVVFTVTDTGIGIPEDMIPDIFKLYTSDKKKSKGASAGLPIAKGYADLLAGDLSCESVYGAGTTFTLSLDQPMADLSQKTGGGAKIEGRVSKEIAESLWLPDVSVLLVDDDDVSLELSKKMLSTFELKVDIAKNGMAAIDMVMNREYDAVFMDVVMPVMNGVDAMKEIRELPDIRYQTLPIIAMDMDAIASNKDELIAAGFTDSLIKPLDVQSLAALFKDCLPENKIAEKSSDTMQYIEGSRYGEGLLKLSEYIDLTRAIEKIGGGIEVYNKLIVAFYNRNSKVVIDLIDLKKHDRHGLKNRLHSIRMGCAGIGAYDLSKKMGQLESAISRSDKSFFEKHREAYVDELSDLLLLLEDYIGYMQSVSGMTDEEYAKLHQAQKAADEKKSEEESSQETKTEEGIDATILEDVRLAALDNDLKLMHEKAGLLFEKKLTGEDADFMEALKDAVERDDVAVIDELVTTYKDLKG